MIDGSKACESCTEYEHGTNDEGNYQHNERVPVQELPYPGDLLSQWLLSIHLVCTLGLVKVSLNLSQLNPLENIKCCLSDSPINENPEFEQEWYIHKDVEHISVHCCVITHHEIGLH
jgi:hypothetical protein